MIIRDVITLLAQETVGTAGADLLIGELPLDQKECLAAVYAVSPEPHKTFDVYEQTIDFWTRYKSSQDAYDKLKEVQTALHRKYAYDLEHYFVYFSNSLGSIDDMGRTIDRLKLFKLSVRFIYRPN